MASSAVAAAGRLVIDLVQSEWEPLSHCELEQRLDQAVEEILEAELMSGVQGPGSGPSAGVLMQDSQQDETIFHTVGHTAPASTPTASSLNRPAEGPASENHRGISEFGENPTVQYIASLLQKLKWNQKRLMGRAHLSLSHTVFLSLTLLSSRFSYRDVSSTFHLEKGNVHRIFFSFCHGVNTLQTRFIHWPTGQEASDLLLPFSSSLRQDDDREQKGLPKVLGVLGHTRIPIRLTADKPDAESGAPHAKRLRGRPRPGSWLNLELVCDAQGRFIHCSISQDSQRNRGGSLSQRLAQHSELLPPGAFLVAGAGYPLTQHILTPFRSARTPQENLYNRVMETHLRRLETAVTDMKERFGRLRSLDMVKCERARAVVLTCCILHNALLRSGNVTRGHPETNIRPDVEEEEEEEVVMEEEAGVKLRETIANLLSSTVQFGAELSLDV